VMIARAACLVLRSGYARPLGACLSSDTSRGARGSNPPLCRHLHPVPLVQPIGDRPTHSRLGPPGASNCGWIVDPKFLLALALSRLDTQLNTARSEGALTVLRVTGNRFCHSAPRKVARQTTRRPQRNGFYILDNKWDEMITRQKSRLVVLNGAMSDALISATVLLPAPAEQTAEPSRKCSSGTDKHYGTGCEYFCTQAERGPRCYVGTKALTVLQVN
jgi:hypothetical protein